MNTQTSVEGKFIYKNTVISQHYDVAIPFKVLIETIRPTKILEIGTAYGGMTIILRDILDSLGMQAVPIRSYDLYKYPTYDVDVAISQGAKIELLIKNVFNHPYDALLDANEIATFAHQPGPTIILCDGGSKKNEFRILSEFLRTGDIIMAHDYAPNPTYFEQHMRNKIWNWMEIQDTDIDEAVRTYNLTNFMSEQFLSVAWVCKQKS